MAQKQCPACSAVMGGVSRVCVNCGRPMPPARGHALRTVAVVAAAAVAVTIAVGVAVQLDSGVAEEAPDLTPTAAPVVDNSCKGRAEREAWIGAPNSELEGYAPSTFRMSATGACATTLRVREKNCSLVHLLEAYGSKPFMRTAQLLGFQKLSCRYDEFDISTITGNQ